MLRRPVAGLVAIALVVFGVGFADELRGPAPAQPAATLAHFLASWGLDRGVGDYWDSSVVTVVSKGSVEVRPVIAASPDHLVRYDKQSSASWYGAGQHFNFFVFNAGAVWNGVDGAAAETTFGVPTKIYAIGSYRIFVWRLPFTLSTKGSTGP